MFSFETLGHLVFEGVENLILEIHGQCLVKETLRL